MWFGRGETTSGGLSSWWEPVMKAWGPVNASVWKQEASCGAVSVEMGFCKTLYVLHSIICINGVPCGPRQRHIVKTCCIPQNGVAVILGVQLRVLLSEVKESINKPEYWARRGPLRLRRQIRDDSGLGRVLSAWNLSTQEAQTSSGYTANDKSGLKPRVFWLLLLPSPCVLALLQFADSERLRTVKLWGKIRGRAELM